MPGNSGDGDRELRARLPDRALKTKQFAITDDTALQSSGVDGQIVVSGNSIYWFANGTWYQVSGTQLSNL